ncbi:hypothetical protein [Roseburia sp. 499]|uniref:hypothetical protein n=1 Tax=Roseburia sp. 499 TaxID=1261634 RepID=UPI000952BAC8|nr:hypothetical protein [Roseburia sp. 499]WVK70684.1 hypothetical protein BIV20_03885 [Roseburia sp. 499]
MKKKIIKVGIGFILLIMVITIAIVFYKHEKEKERLSREPYFTEYELNDTEMDILNLEYHVKVTPEMRKLAKEDNEDIWPDFRFVTIEPTEDTEVVVTVMNYLLFDCQEESNKSGRETANKYGISKENRLTVEWVMSHPREAVDIMNEMLEARNDFMYLWNGIYSLYEKITGTPLERSEP